MAKQKVSAKAYNYEWKTAEEVIANINTQIKWSKHMVCSIAELTKETNPEIYRKAHALWLKLKVAFNAEAETYDPEAYSSKLGSVGEGERSLLCRFSFFAPSGLLPLLCFTPIQYRINRKEPSETPSKHETFLKNFCTEKPPFRTVLLV